MANNDKNNLRFRLDTSGHPTEALRVEGDWSAESLAKANKALSVFMSSLGEAYGGCVIEIRIVNPQTAHYIINGVPGYEVEMVDILNALPTGSIN